MGPFDIYMYLSTYTNARKSREGIYLIWVFLSPHCAGREESRTTGSAGDSRGGGSIVVSAVLYTVACLV